MKTCSLQTPSFNLDNTWAHTLVVVFVLIAIVIVVYAVRWRFSLNHSKDNLSVYSPDLLSDDPSFSLVHLKNKTVVIATMLRDAEDRLPSIRKRATMMMDAFKDSRFLVVENDSSDSTRQLLLEWARDDRRVTVLGCGVNVSECKLQLQKSQRSTVERSRIQKMVLLRNVYLQYFKEHYSRFDHLIVWDMDIIGAVYLDALDKSMERFDEQPSLDALCARGVYEFGPLPIYYDTYAHATEDQLNQDDGVSLLSHINLQTLGVKAPDGDQPFRVKSCFSGFTIYKSSSVMNSEYRFSAPDEKLKCEHITFHEKLEHIELDPRLKHLVLVNP